MKLSGDSLLWNQPNVFYQQMTHCSSLSWKPNNLPEAILNTTVRLKIGKKDSEDIQWETKCVYKEATIRQFIEWLDGRIGEASPLKDVEQESHWCYIDYKYMSEIFKHNVEILNSIDWSSFGLPERNGKDCTFWFGSPSSCTPCHYDSYGCNLVFQVYGRKQWVLFPPEDTPCLYPTRIPYEESSIFSQVNITRPNLDKHYKFKNSHPYIVTLEPGDVLFVPRHWWHFVESKETTISINTWLEMEIDAKERFHEAICRNLAMINLSAMLDTDWLNPTEDFTLPDENLGFLESSMKAVCMSTSQSIREPFNKKVDISQENTKTLTSISFNEYLNIYNACNTDGSHCDQHKRIKLDGADDTSKDTLEGNYITKKYLNALMHPSTIGHIANIMIEDEKG